MKKDSIIEIGIRTFGSIERFNEWLQKENFYFDNKRPVSFLTTIKDQEFLVDRLIGMQFGDNV